MPRITKVYTRTGDDGTTGLGGGQRVGKDTLRIEAYGTVDELNSVLGVALAAGLNETLVEALGAIQNELFHLGSDLCILEEDKAKMPVPRIEERHVVALETLMDRLSEELSPLENFILPGGTPGAAAAPRRPHRLPPRRAHRHRPRPPGARRPLDRQVPEPPLRRPLRHGPPRKPAPRRPRHPLEQPRLKLLGVRSEIFGVCKRPLRAGRSR